MDDIHKVQGITELFVSTLLKEEASPLVIAAVFSAMSLSIYKNVLSPEEYDAMVLNIHDSRHRVPPFFNSSDAPTLH